MSEEQSTYSANPGKQLVRTVDGVDYQRIPVKTHLITNTDDMADVVVRYAKDRMQEGDILFISEKAVACTQNRAIPTEGTIPPYDHCVVLTPADPMGTSRRLAQALGHPVAIVDINDLGANILGCSQKEPSMALLARILGDNPLGQSSECTPMGIIRKV